MSDPIEITKKQVESWRVRISELESIIEKDKREKSWLERKVQAYEYLRTALQVTDANR